jgi:cytochrome c-type biogenesis protein CcmH/NrfF
LNLLVLDYDFFSAGRLVPFCTLNSQSQHHSSERHQVRHDWNQLVNMAENLKCYCDNNSIKDPQFSQLKVSNLHSTCDSNILAIGR